MPTLSFPADLPDTKIYSSPNSTYDWITRVHRHANKQRNVAELHYFRDSAWHIIPTDVAASSQHGVTLSETYQQPTTLECYLPDNEGYLTPENLNSPYNYNSSNAYEPLLDVARKIRLRVGVACYPNLAAGLTPSSTVASSPGSLSNLTDGNYADYTSALPASLAANWNLASAGYVDVTFDLSSSKYIHACAIRFGTKTGQYALPDSVQLQLSQDGTNYITYPARPVGGTLGDWEDSDDGLATEINLANIETNARYIRFHIVASSARSLSTDEILILGGGAAQLVGANLFTGYLGDELEFTPRGLARIRATDATQKAADNNEARLTAQFGALGNTTPPDIADIAYTLLTAQNYWRGTSGAYDAPFLSSEIGWTPSTNLTRFPIPLWQGQSNNIYGYVLELFHIIGWRLYVDGDGTWQASEPPYTQLQPDRILIAAPDGNNDVWDCTRHRTAKEMRNIVEVAAGKSKTGTAGANIELEPNSIARYGRRRNIITDPLAITADLRTKIAQSILRDYAWRLQTLSATLRPDFQTHIRTIHALRAPSRPALFARASTQTGAKRLGEYWSLHSLTHTITQAQWKADATYIPYVAFSIAPPNATSFLSFVGTTYATLTWAAYNPPRLAGFNTYISSVSEAGPFTKANTSLLTSTTAYTYNSLTTGNTYWAYVTSVDTRGHESVPSAILSCIAGTNTGASGTLAGWVVTDLAAAYNQIAGPDAGGYYTYEFYITWTSPPAGFKRMSLYFNIGSIPSSPTDRNSWSYQDEWHGAYIPPGLTWDRVTAAPLTWYGRFRTSMHLSSGTRVYWSMWTSTTTNGWHNPQQSNITYGTVP